MDQPPIDINSKRKEQQRVEDLKEYLQQMLNHIIDMQNKLAVRAEDLKKDGEYLTATIMTLLEEINEKYPELIPNEEDLENEE